MLWQLCEDGELHKVRAALARGENVNSSQPVFGISALMWAVREKHNSIVKVLMKQPDLDVNMRDWMGLTALHWAASHYNAAAVPLLLAHPRIDVNCKSNIGRNALFCAALYGNVEAVRFLLTDQRSDVNNVDKDGLTLLHAASYEDSQAAVGRGPDQRCQPVGQGGGEPADGCRPGEEREDCVRAGGPPKCRPGHQGPVGQECGGGGQVVESSPDRNQ